MPASRKLTAIGVHHRTSPVEIREALAMSPNEIRSALTRVRHIDPRIGCAILSTCNRTEVFVSATDLATANAVLKQVLTQGKTGEPCGTASRWRKTDAAVFAHLARVATGLDSAVLGDVQILGQLKQARSLAEAESTLDPLLRELFDTAIRVGREARATTVIARGAASVGGAAATLLAQTVGPERDVLLVGTGSAGRNTALALRKRGYRHLILCNRTESHAWDLARMIPGATVVSWSQLDTQLSRCAAVIMATAAPRPVLDHRRLERLNRSTVLPVLDLGMPCQTETHQAVSLVALAAVQATTTRSLHRRQTAIPAVEDLLAQASADWTRTRASARLDPLFQALYADLLRVTEQIAAELESADRTPQQLRTLLQRGLKRLLHPHVHRLRDVAAEFQTVQERP